MKKREQHIANVVAKLSEAGGTWSNTQKALAEAVGVSQPELSVCLRELRNRGQIVTGQRLGFRGRNFEIILAQQADEHILDSEHHFRIRREQNERIQKYRDELNTQHQLKLRILEERDRLQERVDALEAELVDVRGKYNQLLITSQHRPKVEKGSYQVKELVDPSTRALLAYLSE